MPTFKPPECAADHPSTEMTFLESFDPLAQEGGGIGSDCTDWQKRWRYACPDCGHVVEIRETLDGDYQETTVRESTERAADAPTSLNPVRE